MPPQAPTQTPLAPQPVASPPQPVAPPPQAPIPQPAVSMPSAGGPKKGLIIGIIAGIVGLVLVALLYMFVFSPAAMSKRASTHFMKGMTSGDVSAALKYATDADSQSTKDFLSSASDQSKGSFTLLKRGSKDGKYYFLYDLSNDQGKEARTTVEKGSGGWKVTSYVYGSDNLALIPGDSAEPSTTPTETTTASTKTCLTNDDFKSFWKENNGYALDSTFDPSKNGTSDNFHFVANSTNYSPDEYNADMHVKAYGHFARDNTDKDFTIEYYGSAGSNSKSDLDLADQRAEKIKNLLIKNGASDSQLVNIPSKNVYGTSDGGGNSETDRRRDRVVVISIVPSKTCGGTNSIL